jgi:predicted SAM-dependent methyltransferase
MREKNLNLGCGAREFPDCVNVDIAPVPIPHITWNLNDFPYPFDNERFERVYAYDIIEHLDDVYMVMDEIHRILKPGGEVHIRTAAWDTAQSYDDPSHKHWFTLKSFDFFDPTTQHGSRYPWFSRAKFSVLVRQREGSELVFVLEKM